MTLRIQTSAAYAPAIRRRRGLVAWLLRLDTRYRNTCAMRRLTDAQRRDMGLPPTGADDRKAGNSRFLTGQW